MPEITCRAKLVGACLHGKDTYQQFGEPDRPMSDDGTFDGESIVCDPCYIALMPYTPSGRALTHEVELGITHARNALGKT